MRYKLSYRDVEELIGERGLKVDHSTVNRWVIKYAPLLAAVARRHKRAVGLSWRLDETYIKVAGGWKYYYRAVDKEGDTIDFLLTAKRDKLAATRFLRQAIRNNCTPAKINIDKSGSNTSAIKAYNDEAGTDIEIRQCKYPNNIVVQSHIRVAKVPSICEENTASLRTKAQINQSSDGIISPPNSKRINACSPA